MAENIPSAEFRMVYKTKKKPLFPKIVLRRSLLFLKSSPLPWDKGQVSFL